MLDCIIDRIGVRRCGTGASPSGYFVDDIPGASCEFLDKIADSDQVTFAGVWVDIQNRMINRLATEAFLELRKCHKVLNKACAESIICGNLEAFDRPAWWLAGVELMIERRVSPRWNKWTISKDEALKLQDEYMLEFLREIKIAVETVDLTDFADCVACDGGSGVKFINVMP